MSLYIETPVNAKIDGYVVHIYTAKKIMDDKKFYDMTHSEKMSLLEKKEFPVRLIFIRDLLFNKNSKRIEFENIGKCKDFLYDIHSLHHGNTTLMLYTLLERVGIFLKKGGAK